MTEVTPEKMQEAQVDGYLRFKLVGASNEEDMKTPYCVGLYAPTPDNPVNIRAPVSPLFATPEELDQWIKENPL